MKLCIPIINLTVAFCLSFISNAQLNISFNGFPTDEAQNVLFRGFDNILEITTNDDGFEFSIETENVASIELDTLNKNKSALYIVKVKTGKVATFKFIKKGETQVFQTASCQLSNFPDPPVHFGGVPSGGKTPRTANEISVKQLMKIRYKDSYQITKFSMFIADQELTSNNGELTDEMRKILDQSISGDEISFNCSVLADDGIMRLLGGTFTVE